MQMTLNISEQQSAELDKLSARRNTPREALLSEAVEEYLLHSTSERGDLPGVTPAKISDPEERRQNLLKYFGALPHMEDGMAFQDRMRNEWVREWDPEYDPKIHG